MMVSVMVSALWGRQLVCRAVAAFAAFVLEMMSKLLWQERWGACLWVLPHWLHIGMILNLCTGQNLSQRHAMWEGGRQSRHGVARHADTSSYAGLTAQQLQVLTL